MAESKDEPIVDINETYSNVEQYVIDNQKSLSIILGAIVVLVGGFFAWKYLYVADEEIEAQNKLFHAERYFEQDSLDKAINGAGPQAGLLEIAENYGVTPSGNLARYYLGLAYLKKGEYEKAIENLGEFDSDDIMVSSVAKGAMGDAYMELGKTEDAIAHYLEAANDNKNDFTSPLYLKKAALAYEEKSEFKEAVTIYEQIRSEFGHTRDGQDIQRYLARAKSMAGM